MNWEMLRAPEGAESKFKAYRHPNGLRCGWCIGDDHRNCVVAVRMGHEVTNWTGSRERMTTAWRVSVWKCECTVTAHQHPRSRCVICLRPGVEVDHKSTCADGEDCKSYRVEYGTYIRPTAPVLGDDYEDDEEECADDERTVAV